MSEVLLEKEKKEFIVTKIEIIPMITHSDHWYDLADFDVCNAHTNISYKPFKKVVIDDKVYIYNPIHKKILFADNKYFQYKYTYDSILKVVRDIPIGPVLTLKDLHDCSKEYLKDEKCLVLSIKETIGQWSREIAKIAKVYITDTNGNIPNDICLHCNQFIF